MQDTGRPRDLTVATEGWGRLREEGDDNNGQFSNNGIVRCDIVCQYQTGVKRDRGRSVSVVKEEHTRKQSKGGKEEKGEEIGK